MTRITRRVGPAQIASTATADANAIRKAAAIHGNDVVGHQPIQRLTNARFPPHGSRYTHPCHSPRDEVLPPSKFRKIAITSSKSCPAVRKHYNMD